MYALAFQSKPKSGSCWTAVKMYIFMAFGGGKDIRYIQRICSNRAAWTIDTSNTGSSAIMNCYRPIFFVYANDDLLLLEFNSKRESTVMILVALS